MNSCASTVIFRQRFEPLRRYENVTWPSSHETIRRSLMATRKTYGARYFNEARPSPTALRMDHPVLPPHRRIDLLQQAGAIQGVPELGAEEDR